MTTLTPELTARIRTEFVNYLGDEDGYGCYGQDVGPDADADDVWREMTYAGIRLHLLFQESLYPILDLSFDVNDESQFSERPHFEEIKAIGVEVQREWNERYGDNI